MIDQDLPHRLRRHAEKMSPLDLKNRRMLLQFQECLMHQRGRLERVSRRLRSEPPRGNAAELRIDLRREILPDALPRRIGTERRVCHVDSVTAPWQEFPLARLPIPLTMPPTG